MDLFVNGRLFSNGLGRATDVTDRAGIHLRDRPVAAAFGDYDNEGPLGLLVAAFGDFNGDGHTDLITLGADGRIVLYQNLGQGHFADATLASGIDVRGHVDAIALGDYDNDGFLDLFVSAGNGVGAVLYHNRGD